MKKKAFIPVSALMGVLLLTLVATMTLFVAEPDRAHAQAPPPQLGSLTVGGNAIGGFASGSYNYTITSPIRVSSATSSITVSAGASAGARVQAIKYGPSDSVMFMPDTGETLTDIPGSAATGNVVPLRSAESTDIAVVVVEGSVPQDGTVYVVRVTRVASDANNDADLMGLEISSPSGVALVPDFDADTTSYTVFVPYDVDDSGNDGNDEITIGATAEDAVTQTVSAGATVTITPDDSDTDASGHQVELAEGRNVITATVEAANVVTKKRYTVTVTRAAANASDDARLSSLTVGGEAVSAANIELADGVGTDVDYITKVSFATESVQIRAVKMHSGATVVIRTSEVDAATAVTGAIDTDGRVSLTAGTPRFIAVQVTAEDGKSASQRNYILRVTRVASDALSDANLTDLGISSPTGIDLAPAFDEDTTSYTAFVPYDVDDGNSGTANNDEITITATRSDADDATVKITSNQDSEIETDNMVELAVGRNVITLTVRAADVVTTKTYTVTVTRAAESGLDEARLSALMVGGANVSVTGFTDGVDVDYTANVPNTTARIQITATPMDSGAVVAIRTSEVDAATAVTGAIDTDGRISLTAGTPIFIAVQVTAADGSTTHNYILRVTRAVPGASADANLTALGISSPTGIDLAPAFDEDTTSYTAFVPYDVDDGNSGTANNDEITITATRSDADDATVKITSNQDSEIETDNMVELAVGRNVITIMVTAADAVTTKTYTLTVTRAAQNASDNASLSALMVGDETVSLPLPEFDPNNATTTYVTGVPNVVNTIQIAATATHTGATVVIRTAATEIGAVTGTIDADGAIPVIVGYMNFIAIQVMAEDGTAASNKTYMLQVNRAPAGASSDAKLSALTTNQGILSPVFDPDTMAYTADVIHSIGSVMVTATGFVDSDDANNSSTVRIMSDTDAEIGNDDNANLNVAMHGSIGLMNGANVITIMVTAADYSEMETYTVTVTRAAEEGTLLSRYDADDSGDIDLSEVSAAIDDYFNDDLTLAEVSAVIDLYFQ